MRRVVCKCPACPDGSIELIRLKPFKDKFQCNNYYCQTRRQKRLDRPDGEKIKELVRQFYWWARENPTRGKTTKLEKLTEQVTSDILALIPDIEELFKEGDKLLRSNYWIGKQSISDIELFWQSLKDEYIGGSNDLS